jgi:hypothetical protein
LPTTVADLCEDENRMREVFGNNENKILIYRKKFAKIRERAGIDDIDLDDPESYKRVTEAGYRRISMQTVWRSWNWSAFFGIYYWGIYRRDPIMGWGAFAILFPLIVLIPWEAGGTVETLLPAANLGMCIGYATSGDLSLFYRYLGIQQRYTIGARFFSRVLPPARRVKTPSVMRAVREVYLAIIVSILLIAISFSYM